MPETLPILRARRERRIRRQRTSAGRSRNAILSVGMVVSLIAAALIIVSAVAYANLTEDLPSVEILPRLLNPPDGLLLRPTRIYDRTGTHLLRTFAPTEAPRRYIPLSESNPQHLPRVLAEAVVAIADPQFWTHSGYALQGTDNPDLHPTLAQRLAYGLLLYREPPSFRRALRERLLAAQITAHYGRTQVLEWYLNSMNLGRDAYGADAAAQLYFGKSADALTLAESTLLVGVSESPALNPLDAPQVALQRGREVLRLLDELGLVPHAEAERALAQTPSIQPAPPAPPQTAAAFINMALAQLDSQFTRERVERGGLSVITTLDFDVQQQASCLTELYAARLAGLPEPVAPCEAGRWLPSLPPGLVVPDSSASALVLDPQTGQVLAIAGETLQRTETPLLTAHSPGSSTDAFAYLTGFTTGLGPASLVWDIPGQVDVENLDRQYHGPMRVRTALANDYRVPAAVMRQQMGVASVARIAESFGLRLDAPVTMLDLAGAYGAFGTQGVYFGQHLAEDFSPVAVLRVDALDHAVLLDWTIPQATPVVSSAMAYLMTDVLSDEAAREPSLGKPNVLEIGRPAGVKLGQSADGQDAWAIGYTPTRVVVTWTGALGSLSPTLTQGARGFVTPRMPAVLYAALMQVASQSLPADGWAVPEGVTAMLVCDPSGLLPTPECPEIVSEVFLSGNEPQQPDNLYRKFIVNAETGFLATVFTPPQFVEERVYLIAPPEAREWALSAGLPVPPDSYDAIRAPRTDPDVNISAPALFAEVQGVVKITGTAAGADFASYRVLVGQGLNPQEWIEVGRGDAPVTDGLLAEWDTQGLSGLYAVQLVVTRSDQRVDTAVIQVTIGE